MSLSTTALHNNKMNKVSTCIVLLALLVAYCQASTAQYSNSIAAVAVSSTLSSDEPETLEQNEDEEVLATTTPPSTKGAPVRFITANTSVIPASAVPPNGYFLTNGVCATR